jgi:hypothetical protein
MSPAISLSFMADQSSRYPAIGVTTNVDQSPVLVTDDRVLARHGVAHSFRWSARSGRDAVDRVI